MKTRRNISLLLQILLLILISPVTYGNIAKDFYAVYMQQQALTADTVNAICTEEISPRQAAEKILLGMNFTVIPQHFRRVLHRLTYQLGQLTQWQPDSWTTETMAICDRLLRYDALFITLENLQQTNRQQQVIVLGALPIADFVPLTDRLPVYNITSQPNWQARSGQLFRAVLIALPLQPLPQLLQYRSSAWSNTAGSIALPPPEIFQLEYFINNGNWQYKKISAPGFKPLAGMQIFLMEQNVPQNIPPGNYIGSFSLENIGNNQLSALYYTITVNP